MPGTTVRPRGHKSTHARVAVAPRTETSLSKSQEWLYRLLLMAICALPLIPMARLDSTYTIDWANHSWVIAYFGEYFREHGWFPVVLNSNQTLGMPYPVFYGFFFYPVAGVLSTLTGANVALRLFCTGMMVWQTCEVAKTARLLSGNRWIAAGFAALIAFAVYPMTDLYNRGAITEFVATSMLAVLTCVWLRFVFHQKTTSAAPLMIGFVLAFSFILGTHPITAVLGAMSLALLALLTFRLGAKPLPLRPLLIAAGAGLVLVAPFLYAYSRFGSQLEMSGVRGILVYTTSLDNIWIRFSPWPRDYRVERENLATLSSPHLDTQINVPMLLLCLYLFVVASREFRNLPVRERKWLTASSLSFALFAAIAGVSVTELILPRIEKYVGFIQFAYRLVTYCDLFLLITGLMLLIALRGKLLVYRRSLVACFVLCVAISTTGLIMKLDHARVRETHEVPAAARNGAPRWAMTDLPPHFYGSAMYAVTTGVRPAPTTLGVYPATFPVGGAAPFDRALPLQMRAPDGFVLKTNVQVFPWNHILINGTDLPRARYFHISDFIALPSSPTVDNVEYQVRPEPIWLALRALSFLTAGILILWLLFVFWSVPRIRM